MSVAHKTMYKSAEIRLEGMKDLGGRRIRKWTKRPEPDPQVNIFIIYMENVDSLPFTG